MAIENTRWNAYKSSDNNGIYMHRRSQRAINGLLHWEVTTLGWINA